MKSEAGCSDKNGIAQSGTWREINQLRKIGKLDDAERLAAQLLEMHHEDRFVRSAAAWVYRDRLKEAREIVRTSREKGTNPDKSLNPAMIGRVESYLEAYYRLTPTVPDICHSLLLGTLRGVGRQLPRFLKFSKWALKGEPFRSEDWEPYKTDDGKAVSPVAVSIAHEVVKWCLLRQSSNTDAEWAFSIASNVYERSRSVDLAYDLAQVSMLLKRDKEAIGFARIVAAVKQRESWAWKTVADAYRLSGDRRMAIAALCRACDLGRKDEFTGPARSELAELLAQEGMYAWAASEASRVRDFYASQGWKLRPELSQLLSATWFESAALEEFDSAKARKEHSAAAIEALCENVRERRGCFVGVGYKGEATLIMDNGGAVRILRAQPNISKMAHITSGDEVVIRCGFLDGRVHVLSWDRKNLAAQVPAWQAVPTAPAPMNLRSAGDVCRFTGVLRKLDSGGGFLNGSSRIFVGRDIADSLVDGSQVEVVAVWELTKKKNEMGWKAVGLC